MGWWEWLWDANLRDNVDLVGGDGLRLLSGNPFDGSEDAQWREEEFNLVLDRTFARGDSH